MVRKEIVSCLVEGGVGVMPTDTVYGIVGSALRRETVERLYRLRRREAGKPFIVLIASPRGLARFGVRPNARTHSLLAKVWPGPVTVILPCPLKRFAYLHRGTNTLAFRVPRSAPLRALLAKTGPLAAPSANIAGKPPARTAREAFAYFRGNADFYVDGGMCAGIPSSLIEVKR